MTEQIAEAARPQTEDRGGGGGRDRDRDRDRDPRAGGDRGDYQRRRPMRRRRMHRGKVCSFCINKAVYIDYKTVDILRRYLTDRGKILPRRITGNCASHQRMLCTAIKRARNIALIPFKAK